MCIAQNQLDDAIAALERARSSSRPSYYQAAGESNLAAAFQLRGDLDKSIRTYRQVLKAKPEYAQTHSNLLFAMLFHPDLHAATIWEEHRHFNEQHALPLTRTHRAHQNDRSPDRRLRIGYVSPDFRDHVVGRNLLPLLSNHDHQKFDVFCYASVTSPDPLTAEFQKHADHWRSIAGVPDGPTAEMIRDAIRSATSSSISRLHMSMNRLLVFARKPAPVQMTFAGYPGTTGLSAIDYRLTDPHLDPPETDNPYCSEKALRLANSFWCYAPLTDDAEVSALPASSNGYVTFGCLNNFCKINDAVLKLWSEVLRALPTSRLILLAPQGSHRQRVLDFLAAQGIWSGRIEFFALQPRRAYMQLYHRIDIMLDSFPYNGHTTSLDALWMGVPVVTLVGSAAVCRARDGASCRI